MEVMGHFQWYKSTNNDLVTDHLVIKGFEAQPFLISYFFWILMERTYQKDST